MEIITGGILGLFTGISILSMMEVGFWIVRYMVKIIMDYGRRETKLCKIT